MSKSRSSVTAFVCLTATFLVALLGATSGALANDAAAEAEQLIRRGIQLRKTRDDQAAAREFQKAYQLVRSPRAAGQLGLAEQALGRWEDAERHVSEAIRATDDPWVSHNRAVLDRSLATIQQHLGRVEITGDPEGAEVSVNGHSIGKLPLPEPVRVSAGQVDIDLRAPGFAPAQRTLTIVGGQYQPVVIHLAKDRAPIAVRTTTLPEAAPPKVDSPSAKPTPTAPPSSSTATDVEAEPSGTRIALKWTAAGLAGAGLATGIAGLVLYRQNVNKFDTDSRRCGVFMGAGYSMVSNMVDPTCQSLLDSYKTDEKVAIVGVVAAGVFAATWLALLLTEPSGPPETAQAAWWPTCAATTGGGDGAGIACMGRF